MTDIINHPEDEEALVNNTDSQGIQSIMQGALEEARSSIESKDTMSLPITGLEALGAGVASLVPAFRTVTSSSTINMDGLYKIANQKAGFALKQAKDGTSWGAMENADGVSKMVKLRQVDGIQQVTKTTMPFDPTMLMIAMALYSIEKDIGEIKEMEKQILDFLEFEKEAEIEADVEMLTSIIEKFKDNWDNEHFVASNHKMVLDIQRTARKNMLVYEKMVETAISSKQFIVGQAQVNSSLEDLLKKFKYYRLSLYNYSLASMEEVMLSGNFKEENITAVNKEIEKLSLKYRETYRECSMFLEDLSKVSIETNVMKGIGIASKAVGKFIGKIPVVKEGQVDEFLQESGEHLKGSAKVREAQTVKAFTAISDPVDIPVR